MVLNPDCVRDLMLAIESRGFLSSPSITIVAEDLTQYTLEELEYTALKLHEGGFINAIHERTVSSISPRIGHIVDLTFNGHEYLNTIRGQDTWDKTKATAKKVGSYSLNLIKDIAQSLISAAVTTSLQRGI